MLLLPVVVEALAFAASWSGSLENLDIREFYDKYVTTAMGLSPDDPPLLYDAFTVLTLREAFSWLHAHGYLARRGNGDSCDYRLAWPMASRG